MRTQTNLECQFIIILNLRVDFVCSFHGTSGDIIYSPDLGLNLINTDPCYLDPIVELIALIRVTWIISQYWSHCSLNAVALISPLSSMRSILIKSTSFDHIIKDYYTTFLSDLIRSQIINNYYILRKLFFRRKIIQFNKAVPKQFP